MRRTAATFAASGVVAPLATQPAKDTLIGSKTAAPAAAVIRPRGDLSSAGRRAPRSAADTSDDTASSSSYLLPQLEEMLARQQQMHSVMRASQAAALADAKLEMMMEEEEGDLDDDNGSTTTHLTSSDAIYQARERHLRDVDTFCALVRNGDVQKGLRLLSTMSGSAPGNDTTTPTVVAPSTPKHAITTSKAVRTRLTTAIDALQETHDTHALEALVGALTPAGTPQLHVSPLQLTPTHQRALYRQSIDALLASLANSDYKGATNMRGGGGRSSSNAAPQEDFHHRRLRIIADAAESLPIEEEASRSWLDTKYRGIPTSLSQHEDAVRVANKVYRRFVIASRQQDEDRINAEASSASSSVVKKAPAQQPLTTAPPMPPPPPTPPTALANAPLLMHATPSQLRQMVDRYEAALNNTLGLVVAAKGAVVGTTTTTSSSSSNLLPASLVGNNPALMNRLRQLQLQTMGQPLVALLYLRDYKRLEGLLNKACGSGANNGTSSLNKQLLRQAQTSALAFLLKDAGRAAARGDDNGAAQRRFLQKIFTRQQAHQRGGNGMGVNNSASNPLTLVTGRSPAQLAHDVHLAFIAETTMQNRQRETTRVGKGRDAAKKTLVAPLPPLLPAMAADGVVSSHFTSTMKMMVRRQRDSVGVVNMAFASSIVLKERTPCWAEERRLFGAVVSATCRELERGAVVGAVGPNGSRKRTPSPNTSSSSSSHFSITMPTRSILNPEHPLHHALVGHAVGAPNAGGGAGEVDTTVVRTHRTIMGFAQHLLTDSNGRFPLIADGHRVAIMASLLNSGNKAGLVKRSLVVGGNGGNDNGGKRPNTTATTTSHQAKGLITLETPRQKLLWDLAWFLSNNSYAANFGGGGDCREAQAPEAHEATATARAPHALPSTTAAEAQAAGGVTAGGLATLWRLLQWDRTSTAATMAPNGNKSITATNGHVVDVSFLSGDAASKKGVSSQKHQQTIAPLIASIFLSGPQQHHQTRNVKDQYWAAGDATAAAEEKDVTISALEAFVKGVAVPPNRQGLLKATSSSSANSAASKNTSTTYSATGDSIADHAATAQRREALSSLAALIDTDDDFRAILEACLAHHSTAADEGVRGRFESLLKAEGMM